MKWQGGGDVSTGGRKASEEGTYHFGITNVQEPAQKTDGSIVANSLFRIDLEILEGTTKSEIGKPFDLVFFAPKGNSESGDKWAKKKVDRLMLATGALTREQIETQAEVDVDLKKINGRQFVARLVKGDDPKYLELAYADIFHVDDPAVKDIPKKAEMLALIAPSLRWISGKPAASNGAAKKEAAPAQTASVMDDL